MIDYDSNDLTFVCKLEGSVIPKSLVFAIPSIILTVCAHVLIHSEVTRDHFNFTDLVDQWSVVWSACVIVLGMLLGVRTNKAYGRFWEGITLVQQMRAEWFEATSNLVAFSMVACKKDISMTPVVIEFQEILIRLMSLMHGAALRQIGGNEEEFDVLDIQSLDDESLRYLAVCEENDINRVEVILHWIQVLVTDGAANGVIVVPPPVLSRSYQTLSRGMVNLHNARKLADVPFPFPLSQMTLGLLILHSIFTPLVVSGISESMAINVGICFVPIFGMWGLTFVAGELEQPFGSDPNDLPLSVLQYDFNTTLLMLLDKEVARAPKLVAGRTRSLDELKLALSTGETFEKTNFAQQRLTEFRTRTLRKCSSQASLQDSEKDKKKKTGSHKARLEERKRKKRASSVTSGSDVDPAESKDRSPAESECTSNRSSLVETQENIESMRVLSSNSNGTARLVSIPENTTPSQSLSEDYRLVEGSVGGGKYDFALNLTEQRVEELLDASTQASRVLTALLREPFVKVQLHRDSNKPKVLRQESRGVAQKRIGAGTNPRTPRSASPMPTPREDDLEDVSGVPPK